MRIERIDEQLAEVLDHEANCFTSCEEFVISVADGEIRLELRKTLLFTKTYDPGEPWDQEIEAYGAYVDGVLAGKIELAPAWNELASIEHIVVAHEFRGRGIANGLIDFAKSWALSKQLKGIRLETQTNNVGACKLYLRNGFEVGGFDSFTYRTQPRVSNETALYFYWFA